MSFQRESLHGGQIEKLLNQLYVSESEHATEVASEQIISAN